MNIVLRRLSVIMIVLILGSCLQSENIDSFKTYDLLVGNLENPEGIDQTTPRFSWKMKSDKQNQLQSAYQVIVSSSSEKLRDNLGDLWDSKKIESDQSVFVKYGGKKLVSGQEVYWKVQVWNKNSANGVWSESSTFSMGLLNEDDWKGKWIGLDRAVGNDDPEVEERILSARYLRKEFKSEKTIKRATAYIVGMGLNELYINGSKIGDRVLSPGLTQYNKRALYVTYDVTNNMIKGENAIGVILGNGRYFAPRHNVPTLTETYGYPKLLFQLEIEYVDGTKQTIVSNETWKLTANGPIVENNEYDGEYYDATKEMKGWTNSGFDASAWQIPELVEPASPIISAEMNEPIRVIETIEPISVTKLNDSIWIVDMGQNMVGWTKLRIKGIRGSKVTQRFSETLNEDGSLYLANIRGAKVTDTYVLKGQGEEIFSPRFVFHGFRYVEVKGFQGTFNLNNAIVGEVVHDDINENGEFSSSNELINKIYKNAYWGISGNYRSIPMDCPQRDERQGWLGDRAGEARGESYLFGISNLYRKWLTDIYDGQKETGSISDVCPSYWPFYSDNVTWSGSHIFLVEMLYRQYGDSDIIAKSYPDAKQWVDMMITKFMEDNLMPRDVYGDWCVPPVDPKIIHTKDPKRLTAHDYLGSAYFYKILTMMSDFADKQNLQNDVKYYSNLASSLKISFNEKYLDKETAQYSNNSATTSVLALAFGLAPKELEQKVFDNLIDKIVVEQKSHITTGLIGQQSFNKVLTKYGRADLAFKVNTQTDYPSYGYMIENGATTIWELWNGNTADPAMNSGNHVMLLGDFLIWLYEDIAGIKAEINKPGFKNVIMKPEMIAELEYVNAWHNTNYGKVVSEWTKSDEKFNWNITIPANSTASVYLPTNTDSKITKNGEVVSVESKQGYTLVNIGSGNYEFIVK